jgi:phosphoglycolate phosphatase
MDFKGVVFDLDGTLVNSLDDIADSMNAVLQGRGFPVHEVDAYKMFIGNGIRNLVRVTLPESNRDEPTTAACHEQMVELYERNCLNKTKPYDGIIELLNELQARGLKLSVFSNKADAFTNRIVRALLPDCFEIVLGLRPDAPKKPDPWGALHIAEKLGLRPGEFLYIGDSNIDMQTAGNAGMVPVGALWGFRSREELLAGGAEHLIAHPMDLLKLLPM